MRSVPCVLTMAGSDSGGGAGVQADLKTFAAHGCYGASVITALTAQNTREVTGIFAPPAEFAARQLEAVLDDLPVAAAKTGMLFSPEIIEALSEVLAGTSFPLVVDPVAVSQSGATLLEKRAVDTLIRLLAPRADLLTPNRHEAELLTGVAITDRDSLEKAMKRLLSFGCRAVLLKGGHFEDGELDAAGRVTDWFMEPGGEPLPLSSPRLETRNTHGTGCTLSAAIAANLALGQAMRPAVSAARDYLYLCLRAGFDLGRGSSPPHHLAPMVREKARVAILGRLSALAHELTTLPGLSALVPEVGLNVALAAPWPAGVGDVAAFSGRVTRGRDGRVYVNGCPAFGASSHMAKVVLAADSVVPGVRAAINIRFNERSLAAIKAAGLVTAWFDRADEPREVKEREGGTLEWGTRAALAAHKDPAAVAAVADRGEAGKEPMIRLLGRDLDEALSRLRAVLGSMS